MPDSVSGATIQIDRDACMGSGQCLVYAPGSFEHDADAKAVLIDPSTDSSEQIQAAVDSCPMSALTLLPTEPGE